VTYHSLHARTYAHATVYRERFHPVFLFVQGFAKPSEDAAKGPVDFTNLRQLVGMPVAAPKKGTGSSLVSRLGGKGRIAGKESQTMECDAANAVCQQVVLGERKNARCRTAMLQPLLLSLICKEAASILFVQVVVCHKREGEEQDGQNFHPQRPQCNFLHKGRVVEQ
jgi:hypothetical protein